MLEVEVQKLTAAIEALTAELRLAKAGNSLPSFADREDDAVREAMQAERTAMMAKIDGVSNADQQLADLYKAEQAKAKRKAKVTKEEVEALVEAAKPVENPAVTDQPLKDKEDSPKSPEPEKIAAIISENDLKGIAMEIARKDSSARPIILGILGEHGAKTITQLDSKHYGEVHRKFMSLAADIAKDEAPF